MIRFVPGSAAQWPERLEQRAVTGGAATTAAVPGQVGQREPDPLKMSLVDEAAGNPE